MDTSLRGADLVQRDRDDLEYCAQALAKIERGHNQNAIDVANFLTTGLISGEELAAYFEAIAPELYRYPAIDPAAFRQRVERVLRDSA